MSAVAVVHLAAAAAYAGFQWTIRVLVYPQFAAASGLPRPAWAAYAAGHQRRVTVLVGPLFAALVTATAALVATRPASAAAWGCAAATAVVLATTGLGAVPQHRRLAERWDGAAHRRLLRWDGVRVTAASVQLALAATVALGR